MRTAFVYEYQEWDIFGKVGENAKKVFKTLERTNKGHQVDDSEVQPFVYDKDEATGVELGKPSSPAFTVPYVKNILCDVLDHSHI